jgi:plastocyanin
MQKWFALIALVAVLALVAGCTQETPSEPASTPVPTTLVRPTTVLKTPVPVTTVAPSPTLTVTELTVTISDNAFIPKEVTVKVGSQVRWVNADDHPHRVSFVTGGFTAFLLGAGQSSSQKFTRPGVYDYSCMIYPTMKGTVTVTE